MRGFTLGDLRDEPQSIVTSVFPSPRPCVPSFLSRRVQHSHFSAFLCSSIFTNLLKHALALSAIAVRANFSIFRARRSPNIYIYIFCHTYLLSSFWTSRGHRYRPFSPPVVAFNFYCAQGSAIPLLVDFPPNVANSRSRAFRKAICAQEKVPTKLYEYVLGRIRTHETDLYQARG